MPDHGSRGQVHRHHRERLSVLPLDDERGRRIGAAPIIVQWQNGEPFTVVPVEYATKKPVWLFGK